MELLGADIWSKLVQAENKTLSSPLATDQKRP